MQNIIIASTVIYTIINTFTENQNDFVVRNDRVMSMDKNDLNGAIDNMPIIIGK